MKLIVSLAALGFASPAFSATFSGATFDVSTHVDGVCYFVSAPGGNVNFGTYTGAELESTTYIDVSCAVGSTYHVSLDYGLHWAAAYGYTRNMYNSVAGDYLPYSLYTDTSRSTDWATGVDVGYSSALDVHSVYAVLPAGYPGHAFGDYVDTVTATVTF